MCDQTLVKSSLFLPLCRKTSGCTSLPVVSVEMGDSLTWKGRQPLVQTKDVPSSPTDLQSVVFSPVAVEHIRASLSRPGAWAESVTSEKLNRELELDDEQSSKIEEINDKGPELPVLEYSTKDSDQDISQKSHAEAKRSGRESQ